MDRKSSNKSLSSLTKESGKGQLTENFQKLAILLQPNNTEKLLPHPNTCRRRSMENKVQWCLAVVPHRGHGEGERPHPLLSLYREVEASYCHQVVLETQAHMLSTNHRRGEGSLLPDGDKWVFTLFSTTLWQRHEDISPKRIHGR